MDKVDDDIIKESLAIILDTGNRNRIEDQRYALAKDIIKIDHHLLQDHFGEPEVIQNEIARGVALSVQHPAFV